jgi:succinate-semialdehyde dehydrogenase/glutarate-semialdehyde dehydrogenase
MERSKPRRTIHQSIDFGRRSTALVSDERIKGVSLTGSEAAGSSMAEAAGKYLKKSVLELGGSDAFIILEDADIDHAVEMAVAGRFNNNGQSYSIKTIYCCSGCS